MHKNKIKNKNKKISKYKISSKKIEEEKNCGKNRPGQIW